MDGNIFIDEAWVDDLSLGIVEGELRRLVIFKYTMNLVVEESLQPWISAAE